jgi:hypothetical protein
MTMKNNQHDHQEVASAPEKKEYPFSGRENGKTFTIETEICDNIEGTISHKRS